MNINPFFLPVIYYPTSARYIELSEHNTNEHFTLACYFLFVAGTRNIKFMT